MVILNTYIIQDSGNTNSSPNTYIIQDSGNTNSSPNTYIIQDSGPPLHGDALEHCKHGKADVVEAGDAVVWPFPATLATGDVRLTAKRPV